MGAEPENQSPRDLLASLARGENEALTQLYRVLGPQVLGVARRLLGGLAEAEDLTQEIFLEVWERAARYDPQRGSPRCWVLQIVRSRAIDRLRARRARQKRDRAVGADQYAAPTPPEARACQHEQRSRLRRAIEELNPVRKNVLQLCYFEGLAQIEVAGRLEMPLGTVKSHVRRGLAELRTLLESEVPHG